MADLINLRRARKARARIEKERLAAENRVTSGRSKLMRRQQTVANMQTTRRLDGARLEPIKSVPGPPPPDKIQP